MNPLRQLPPSKITKDEQKHFDHMLDRGCINMDSPTPDDLLAHMPAVLQLSENLWATEFARSILNQSTQRNWKPSPKQIEIMRRMVADLISETEDFELINR